MIYYIASTLLFWTVGIWLLKGWEVRGGQRGERPGRIKEAGVPADHRHGPWHGGSIFEIQVPDFVLKPLSMISQVTSPLALVFIGSVIRNMDLKTITLGRDLYAALAMRFVVVPAACVVFFKSGSGAEGDERGIFHAVLHAGHGPDGHYGQTV